MPFSQGATSVSTQLAHRKHPHKHTDGALIADPRELPVQARLALCAHVKGRLHAALTGQGMKAKANGLRVDAGVLHHRGNPAATDLISATVLRARPTPLVHVVAFDLTPQS